MKIVSKFQTTANNKSVFNAYLAADEDIYIELDFVAFVWMRFVRKLELEIMKVTPVTNARTFFYYDLCLV